MEADTSSSEVSPVEVGKWLRERMDGSDKVKRIQRRGNPISAIREGWRVRSESSGQGGGMDIYTGGDD